MTLESPVSPAPAIQPARERRAWPLLLALLIGFALPVLTCLALMVASALSLQILTSGLSAPTPGLGSGGSGPAVAVIRVSGVLISGRSNAFDTGLAASDNIVDQINQAKQDASVKAILLMVNSPGGSVVGSDLIYRALKNAGKPIVVMMGETAASGGYYISMASQWIVANPNSLTGSIGVISEFPNASGLLQKVGVDFVVVTSGPRKDIGSPYREMTESERAYWQAIIDETYQGFVAIVAEGRHQTAEEIKPLADGGVYTGRQALQLGLVDQLGYEDDAVAKAAQLGGITGKPRVVEYKRSPTFFDLLNNMSQSRSLVPSLAEVMNLIGHPTLSARWIGQ
jgi:protease-4